MKITTRLPLLLGVLFGVVGCYGAPDDGESSAQALARPATSATPSAVSRGQVYLRVINPAGGCLAHNNEEETIVDGNCTYKVINLNCRWQATSDTTRVCQCATAVIETRGDCDRIVVGAD